MYLIFMSFYHFYHTSCLFKLNKIIKRRRLDSPSHPSNPALKMIRPGGGSNSGDELEEFDENLIIRVKGERSYICTRNLCGFAFSAN